MEEGTVGEVLSRELPDVPKRTLAQIEDRLALAGVVEARFVKRLKRHHVKHSMGGFLLEYLAQKGMFLSEEDSRQIENANALMGSIWDQKLDFTQVRIFEDVPWPSLNEIPRRFVTASAREGKLWLYGRQAFASLHQKFTEAKCGHLEFDGTMGVGKSYLLVMLALQCFCDFKGTANRLVCLFTLPDGPALLFGELKMALLLAFAGNKVVQCQVSAAEGIDELAALVEDLKKQYKLYFIFDGWNVLDLPRSPALLDLVARLEKGCRSLHGGSACSSAAVHRGAYESHCNPLSRDELDVYLTREGVDEHPLLEEYTGFLPLYVRVFVTCQKRTKSDEELVSAYEKSDEVDALRTSFTRTVFGINNSSSNSKLELYAQLLCGTAGLKESLALLDDQRWVVVRDGHLSLFSHYARDMLMEKLEWLLEAKDLDRIINMLALEVVDQCGKQVPNYPLVAWLVERIVVHIGKRWGIGGGPPVKRVISFDRVPHCATSIPTACLLLKSSLGHCDFVVRFEAPGQDPRLLCVHAYEVSLSLASDWEKPDKFFDPLLTSKFTGNFQDNEVAWAYTFIGPSRHRRRNGPRQAAAGTHYDQQFVSFADLSASFGGCISYEVSAALQAADTLE